MQGRNHCLSNELILGAWVRVGGKGDHILERLTDDKVEGRMNAGLTLLVLVLSKIEELTNGTLYNHPSTETHATRTGGGAVG